MANLAKHNRFRLVIGRFTIYTKSITDAARRVQELRELEMIAPDIYGTVYHIQTGTIVADVI